MIMPNRFGSVLEKMQRKYAVSGMSRPFRWQTFTFGMYQCIVFAGWYNKQTLPFAQRIDTIYTWFTHLQIYVCTTHMYVHSFFRILMYPTNISRLRAEVFPKLFRGLPFPGCKKSSSLKRYPQSWIHDSTSLDPFDPSRLDVYKNQQRSNR